MYNEIHCPFCGSADIYEYEEDFSYKAAFWGVLFLHIFGIIFGLLCRKQIMCYCEECGNEFSFYD